MNDQPLRMHWMFRKTVGDGHYGSETAEIHIEEYTDEVVEVSAEALESGLMTCRRLVHAELRRSPSRVVRAAVEEPKPPTPVLVDDEDEDLPY